MKRKGHNGGHKAPAKDVRARGCAPAKATRKGAPGKGAPACPVAARCGGCDRVGMAYAEQLAAKQRGIEELFADWAAPGDVLPIAGMDDPYHYRNKVTSPFAPGRRIAAGGRAGGARATRGAGKGKGGAQHAGRAARLDAPRREILTGMYAPHSHRLVPTDECLIENRQAKAVILAVRDLMVRFGVLPYDEDAHAGFLRHAVVRVGHESGEVLVTLVTNGREFPGSRAFCRELVRRCPFVITVVQNVNTRQTNVILGEEERTLFGPGFILDRLCGLSFRISSRSFYQVNSVQTEVLYRLAIGLARLTGTETAIDAYCGTGTIGLVAAKNGAARVIGVDDVPAAIRDARQNALHNGIANAEFVAADAGDFMRDLAARRDAGDVPSSGPDTAAGKAAGPGASAAGKADPGAAGDVPAGELVLFMDPPRAGASEAFLDAACVLAPSRIVYISCNPETQVRDVARLAQAGYRVRAVQPVDMFPHTAHVETVAVLSRKSATKTFIPVTVSPKDMGLDEAKAQPTYENIRKYVKETHGLTVSTLNIAQMKAECGLEMECDRSGGKQQPKCPPEKREAILDAFRHFGMIEDDSSEG